MNKYQVLGIVGEGKCDRNRLSGPIIDQTLISIVVLVDQTNPTKAQ